MYTTADPELFILALTVINVMNFIDRGIIPGATDEFTTFIDDTLDVSSPSLFIGLLQSSFIIGICAASPVFASMAHTHNTFSLILSGMVVWTVSALISGSAYYINSYEVLLCGRMLSGVGEAAFMCCTSPWIATNARSASKSKWLAIFFSAMPIGTALGYIYSSILATSVGWQWAFFIEAVYMLPLLAFLYYMSVKFPLVPSGTRHFADRLDKEEGSEEGDLRQSLLDEVLGEVGDAGEGVLARLGSVCSAGDIGLEPEQDLGKGKHQQEGQEEDSTCSSGAEDGAAVRRPTIGEEIRVVMSFPCYVYITLGYGALTGVLIGLATFGSSFFLGLSLFESEVAASTAFGAIVSVAGVVGFPVGGLVVDRLVRKHKRRCEEEGGTTEHADLVMSSLVMAVSGTAGLGLYALLYFLREKFLFLAAIFIATTAIFVCNAATSVGLIYSIPVVNRPFGIAFNAIVMHLIGDVPSPLVAGVLKDHFASGCIGDDDSVSTSDACRDDAPGIRLVMLLISLWLVWCSLFYGLSYWHALRMESRDNELAMRGTAGDAGQKERSSLLRIGGGSN